MTMQPTYLSTEFMIEVKCRATRNRKEKERMIERREKKKREKERE